VLSICDFFELINISSFHNLFGASVDAVAAVEGVAVAAELFIVNYNISSLATALEKPVKFIVVGRSEENP